jgi:hypothetical protein
MDLLCEKEDCDKEATVRYAWPWGEEGLVCDDHRNHLESAAQQLSRSVAFTSLAAAPTDKPPPDLSAELRLAKATMLEQEQELSTLRDQVRRQTEQIGELTDERKRQGLDPAPTPADVEVTYTPPHAKSHHAKK